MQQESTDTLAKILWAYQNLHHPLEKSDGFIVLGSHDQQVADAKNK